MNKDKMREQFEQYAESKISAIAQHLAGRVSCELIELQKRYPKRRLLFQDIMGSLTISVEMFHTIPNTTLEHGGGIWMAVNWAGMQYDGLFTEHLELIDWYNEHSQRFGVCIDPIMITPKGK